MTMYWVNPATGSDSLDGLSVLNAWATPQKAFDILVAGDVLRYMNVGILILTTPIDDDTNAGTGPLPIRIVAADSNGDALTTGSALISGATGGLDSIIRLGALGGGKILERIRLDGATMATNIIHGLSDSTAFYQFKNCRLNRAMSHGIDARSAIDFVNTEIDGHGGNGLNHAAPNRGNYNLHYSSIHDCVGSGWNCDQGGGRNVGALIYDNGGDGVTLAANASGLRFHDSVFFANTGDGFDFGSEDSVDIVNCTSVDNGGFGWNFNGAAGAALIFENNHTDGNTLGASDVTLPGTNHQTGDPLFTNITDGSEDFTPKVGSPLVQNGLAGSDIGPLGLLSVAPGTISVSAVVSNVITANAVVT